MRHLMVATTQETLALSASPNQDSGKDQRRNMRLSRPDYFKTLKIQLIRGRTFDAEDRVGKNYIVVVDESLEMRCFPGQDPIGE